MAALIAFLLGFVGYLPVGNINMTVVQLAVAHHRNRWRAFIFFAAVMEFVYCFTILSGMELLLQKQDYVVWLNWLASAIFILLGMFSIWQSTKKTAEDFAHVPVQQGIFVVVINPLQIPFWMVWGVYVMQNGWLIKEPFSIAVFSLWCSLGTICMLWLYALAGKAMVKRFSINRKILTRFIGILFLVLGIYQAVKAIGY